MRMDAAATWLTLATLVTVCSTRMLPGSQYFYSVKHYFGAPHIDYSDISGDAEYYESIKPAGSIPGQTQHYIHTFWMRPSKTMTPPVWKPPHHRGVIRLPYVPTVPVKEHRVSPFPENDQPSDGPYYGDTSGGVLQGLSHHTDSHGADAGVVSPILSQGENSPQEDTDDSPEWPPPIYDKLRWTPVLTHLWNTAPTKKKKTSHAWWENSQFETKRPKKKTSTKPKLKHVLRRPGGLVMRRKNHNYAKHVNKHLVRPKTKRPASSSPKPTADDTFANPIAQPATPGLSFKPTRVIWSVSRGKPKKDREWWTDHHSETMNKKKSKPKRPAEPVRKHIPNHGAEPETNIPFKPGAKPAVKPSADRVPKPLRKPAPTPGTKRPSAPTGGGPGFPQQPAPASKKPDDEVVHEIEVIAEMGGTTEESSGANPSAQRPKSQDTDVINGSVSVAIERFPVAAPEEVSKDRRKSSPAVKPEVPKPTARHQPASSSAPMIDTTTARAPAEMSDAEVTKAYDFNPPGMILEMAVFYDTECRSSFMETFGSAEMFQDALGTLIAQVQVFYKWPWLKKAVHIVTTEFTYLKEAPNELMKSSEADELLKGFANFTGAKNTPDGQPGHWDVALLLTGKDLHAHSNGKKDNSVLGKAYIGGVGSEHFDNVVVEFGSVNPHRRPMTTFGLQASNVVAHELAHNLGVYHDGPPTNKMCSLDRYMMGPWRTANTTTWWSNCSLDVLESLPEKPKSRGLKPLSSQRLRDLLPLNSWRSLPLPGQRWDADDQCRVFMKSQAAHHGAKPDDMKAVCGKLECASPTRIGLFNAGHALEGTYCGGNNWCRETNCVPFPKSLRVVPGGWSDWRLVANCSQPCLENSVALIHMTRSCTKPKRKNTLEGCEGDSSTMRPCDINANTEAPKCDRKKTNQEYIDEKCAIFSRMKSELKPTGTQVPYSAAQSWRACAIHCGYHNGAFIAAKFFLNDETNETGLLPDGTRCHFDEKTGAAYYCQQGLCVTLLHSLAGLETSGTSQVLEVDEEDWAPDTEGRRIVERYMEYVPGEDFPVLDAKTIPKADAHITVDDL